MAAVDDKLLSKIKQWKATAVAGRKVYLTVNELTAIERALTPPVQAKAGEDEIERRVLRIDFERHWPAAVFEENGREVMRCSIDPAALASAHPKPVDATEVEPSLPPSTEQPVREKPLIGETKELVRQLTKLAGAIDPLLLGGRDAEILRKSAGALTAMGAEIVRLTAKRRQLFGALNAATNRTEAAEARVETLTKDIGYHVEQARTYVAQPQASETDLASARWHLDQIRSALSPSTLDQGSSETTHVGGSAADASEIMSWRNGTMSDKEA